MFLRIFSLSAEHMLELERELHDSKLVRKAEWKSYILQMECTVSFCFKHSLVLIAHILALGTQI